MELQRIVRLRNPVLPYAWGSHTAIAALLGEPVPSTGPQAELWMGAHPSHPSQVLTDRGELPLDAWIARDPQAVLGAPVASRFGGRLPFLLKVLAAERPLSLQVHPSPEQARAGFERENAAGIPLDSPRRCYRDASHKPELLCALTPFHALVGFQPPAQIAARLAELAAPELEPSLREAEAGDAKGLRACFTELLKLDAPARQRVLARAAECARDRRDPALDLVAQLSQAHPGDVGALAPLLMNRIELAPGQAMFLPAGLLHSYLGGVGIELMASSDNVLRGGLTEKHVDVPELLRVLRFEPGGLQRVLPDPAESGESRYATPAEEFALSVVRIAAPAVFAARERRGVEILLCTEGAGEISVDGKERVSIRSGESLLVPGSLGRYRVEGCVTLYRATVGHAATPAERDAGMRR